MCPTEDLFQHIDHLQIKESFVKFNVAKKTRCKKIVCLGWYFSEYRKLYLVEKEAVGPEANCLLLCPPHFSTTPSYMPYNRIWTIIDNGILYFILSIVHLFHLIYVMSNYVTFLPQQLTTELEKCMEPDMNRHNTS